MFQRGKDMKIKTGYKCDECGVVEEEPEFTLQRHGYPEIDALHFCSKQCLIKWIIKNTEEYEKEW